MERLIHVGVPSLNEAASIVSVTEQIDAALHASFPDERTVIVNADNPSTDGTQEAFLTAKTRSPKDTLKSAACGKGRNFELLFRHAIDRGADVLVTLDADLEAIPDDWLTELATPVLSREVELSVPLYSRYWYDGNMTNQIVCPLVAAVTGTPIRQPIAGDFAFGPSALRSLLRTEWPPEAYGFGVDVFCVLELLANQHRVAQIPLSVGKIHSWRSDTADEVETEMGSKFQAIACATLNGLRQFSVGEMPAPFPEPPPLAGPGKHYSPSHLVETARRALEHGRASPQWKTLVTDELKAGPDGVLRIDDDAWASILARAYFAHQLDPQQFDDVVSVLQVLFYHRIAHVLPGLTDDSVEPMVGRLKDLVYRRIARADDGKASPRRC